MYYFFNWEQGEQFHERIHIVRASVYYLFFLTDSKSVCVRAVRSWRGIGCAAGGRHYNRWRNPPWSHLRCSCPWRHQHNREKATSSPLRLRLSWELANPHPPITTKMSHKLRTHNETTRRTRLISTHLQKKVFFLTLQALVLKLQLKSYKFLSKKKLPIF